MVRWFGLLCIALTAMTAATIGGDPAPADPIEEFYRGKTIELIVGFSAGGGYDTYARLLARHMSRHIPGNPEIVPKNMPGAGSLVAANHLFNAAPADGTVFGTFNRYIAISPLLADGEGVEFEATRFNWLGSLNSEVNVCVTWHTTGVTTWEALRESELAMAATSTTGGAYMYAQLLNHLVGARMRVVTGYPGSGEMLLAMERGEVDGVCSWSWSSAESTRPDWIRDGKVNILMQMALEKHPDLPDVPLVMDLAETDEQRQMLRLILAQQVMGRPFAAPPGVPEERVRALRDAFLATVADPAFLAEARQARLEINPVSGEAVEALLHSVYQTPAEVIDMARDLIKD